MATFLVFTGIIAATVGVMYVLVKLLMLLNGGGKEDKDGQNVSAHHQGKVETARK